VAGAARLYRDRRYHLLAAAVVAAAVVSPQLWLYYAATGRPIVSSYGPLGFDFAAPHLFGVLFSVQKGLFFWSPILLLAVAGLPLLAGSARAFLLPAAAVLAADTYVIASWWDWQFGGSYGHRGFIDLYPILALGLGAFFGWSARRRSSLCAVAVIGVLAVSLSVVQMLQYWNGILPMSDTTWAQYRAVFLRLR
jgi:hypothetical protein